jgi:hypothetical protein
MLRRQIFLGGRYASEADINWKADITSKGDIPRRQILIPC